MAISDKTFHSLADSVAEMKGSFAEMKGSFKTWGVIASVISTAFTFGAIAALGWCWSLASKVTAIQQQLADGGNTKIVAELKSPESTEQLQANLATVAAEVQTARVKGAQPNQKTAALSQAVSQVIRREPTIPEVWQAASQLVSFRTVNLVSQKSRPPCDTTNTTPVEKWHGTGGHNAEVEAGYFYSNCILARPLNASTPKQKRYFSPQRDR
jgi:hypothetical protein